MAFQRFSQVGQIFKSKASISTFGMLSFSSGARQRFNIDENKYKFGALFFDTETRIIGIQLLEEDDGHGVVKLRFRDKGLDLAIKSFLEYYNILPKTTSLYEIEKNEQTGMLLVKLDTAKERISKIKVTTTNDVAEQNKVRLVTTDELCRDIPSV